MKSILIIGMGRFGRHAAMKLNDMKHQVMAIDVDEKRINPVMSYVTNAQIGDATNEDFIKSLGVRDFDICIVAIGDDFQNSLEATSLLKEYGAKLVISRAVSGVHEKFLLKNGADHVVYPERAIAEWTAVRYSIDNIFDYIELDLGHAIFEMPLPPHWIGETVGNLGIRKNYGINIIAFKDGANIDFTINANTKIPESGSMLVLGRTEDIQKYGGKKIAPLL